MTAAPVAPEAADGVAQGAAGGSVRLWGVVNITPDSFSDGGQWADGDAAIEQVLSGMEAADTPDMPVPGRRHRIEHCGFLNADQRRRMKARGIIPVPQPTFIYEFGEVYLKVLGMERSAASYPMRTWLEEGHNPPGSSDSPVCTVDPFTGLYAMLTRQTV